MRTLLVLPTLLLVVLALSLPPASQAEDGPERLEVVAETRVGPGNLTVLPDGRIVTSLHPFYAPAHRVVQVLADGSLAPFPNAAMNADAATGEGALPVLDAVLGLQCDREGVLWLLDTGLRNGTTPKLVAWDTSAGRLHRVLHLPRPATVEGSFVNDLAVDRTNGAIYIADPAPGDLAALIVVDLASGHARRVLQGHPSVVAEDLDLVIDGTPVEIAQEDGTKVRPRVGVNPIALDAEDRWLYFGPMTGTRLWRVRTSNLRNPALSAAHLAGAVEHYADKPICDGISVDDAGNVYITDIGNHAVGVIPQATRRYRILARDAKRLQWPDALSFGPDGALYTVANQLHRSARLHGGTDVSEPPFHVLRVRPLARGRPGR